MPGALELRLDQVEHAGELREQQDPPALLDQLRQHLHQVLELGAGAARACAAASLTSRGSQQTWRSFSSASRITIRLRAKPFAAISCAHLLVHRQPHGLVQVALLARPARPGAGSRSSAAARPRPRPWSGAAGTAGCAAVSRSRRAPSSLLLDRRAEHARRSACRSPSSPGIRKANCDHSSPRWFSIGVPVRHSRCRASSRQTSLRRLAGRVLDRLRLVQHRPCARSTGSSSSVSRGSSA